MHLRFADRNLDRLETDARFTNALPPEVVKSYRRALQFIRAASGEPDLRARKSWHLEKLRGTAGQYSIRLNTQWRLIIEFEGMRAARIVVVIDVVDYHR